MHVTRGVALVVCKWFLVMIYAREWSHRKMQRQHRRHCHQLQNILSALRVLFVFFSVWKFACTETPTVNWSIYAFACWVRLGRVFEWIVHNFNIGQIVVRLNGPKLSFCMRERMKRNKRTADEKSWINAACWAHTLRWCRACNIKSERKKKESQRHDFH